MTHFKHKSQGSALFTLLAGIVITVATLFLLVKLATSGYYSDVAETTPDATQTRIMSTGTVVLGDGTEPGMRTGDQVFNKVCIQCHGEGSALAAAPKIGNNGEWAARIGKGFETLVNHAVNGFTGAGVMPAKGGASDLTDDEVARAVAYMANKSGANFTEPPVQAASAEAGASAAASASTASGN